MSILINESFANATVPLWASAGTGGNAIAVQTLGYCKASNTPGGAATNAVGGYSAIIVGDSTNPNNRPYGVPELVNTTGNWESTVMDVHIQDDTDIYLGKGTYIISFNVIGARVGSMGGRFYSVDDDITLILGTSQWSDQGSGGNTASTGNQIITVSPQQDGYRTQLQIQVEASNGQSIELGISNTFGINLYDWITFIKIA